MRRETANVESVAGPPAVRDLRLERPEAPARTAVVIMGMHRSGTSVLTRVMSLLGCDLPRTLIPDSRNNEAGYWESRTVTDLNDEILASAGTSWDDWTAFNPAWLRSPRAASYKALLLQTLEQEFGDSPIFVVKDPRICRIPSLWLDALAEFGASVRVFHQIRSPIEVGQSLFRRNGIPPEVSHLLWLRHVLDAERGTRGVPRAFSSYHGLLERGSGFVEEAASPLDIPWPRLTRRSADEIDAFIDADLQHHSDDPESVVRDPSLSPWLRDTFAILARWADQGEREEDRAALDDIRSQLDAATSSFYGVVEAACRAGRSLAAEKAERERLEAAANEHEAALAGLRSELEAALGEARAALKGLEREVSARGRAEVALKNSETERARTRGELAAAQERAARFAEERKSLQARLEEVRTARASLQEKLQTVRSKRDALRDERNAQSEKLKAEQERRSAVEEKLRVSDAELRRLGAAMSRLKEEESRARRTADALSRRLKAVTRLSAETRKSAAREMGRALFASRQSRLPPLRYYALRRQAARLRASGLLDVQWYLGAYPDVAKAGLDPAVHFLVHGWKEGREPNGTFADLERRHGVTEDSPSADSTVSAPTESPD